MIGALLLGVAVRPATAATNPPDDCVAIALSANATLRIRNQAIVIPAEGLPVDHCTGAIFESPAVRLTYFSEPFPIPPTTYDSKETDRGVAVGERVRIGGSILKFLRQNTPDRKGIAAQRVTAAAGRASDVPASGKRGAISIDTSVSPQVVVVFDPRQEGQFAAKSLPRDGSLVLSQMARIGGPAGAADRPQNKLLYRDPSGMTGTLAVGIRGSACGLDDTWKQACGSGVPVTELLALSTDARGTTTLEPGKPYSLSWASNAKESFDVVAVPPNTLKQFLDRRKREVSDTALDALPIPERLQSLLSRVTFATLLNNEAEAAQARERLKRDFPRLFRE